MAGVDARKVTEGKVTYLDKGWCRDTVRHPKHNIMYYLPIINIYGT